MGQSADWETGDSAVEEDQSSHRGRAPRRAPRSPPRALQAVELAAPGGAGAAVELWAPNGRRRGPRGKAGELHVEQGLRGADEVCERGCGRGLRGELGRERR